MNNDSPTGRPFLSLLKTSERFVDTRRWSKITNHNILSEIETFLRFLKLLPFKYRSNEYRKLLEDFKITELKLS